MGKKYMVTKDFSATTDIREAEDIQFNMVYQDDRMNMVIPSAIVHDEHFNQYEAYKNYLREFCLAVNENIGCRPAYLTACGFIPIGVEPTILCDIINPLVVAYCNAYGIPYYKMKRMSPINRSYEPSSDMASSHDIWISKLDAAKVVNKPIHNITSMDVIGGII